MNNPRPRNQPEYYYFQNKKIPMYEDNFVYPKKRHHTARYYEALEIIETKKIIQKPIKEALDLAFNKDRMIPLHEKESISELRYCSQSRIIMLKTKGSSQRLYENRETLAKKTGWYFYITGADLPKSELSSRVNEIAKKFNTNVLQCSMPEDISVKLKPLACGSNENSYLLTIGPKKILLDAGIPVETIEVLKRTTNLDAIFISHTHKDHTFGLLALVKEYPNTPVILSQTTLDFFLLQIGCERRDFTDEEKKLIQNCLTVKNGDIIPLLNNNGYFKFFFAGHMPGSLMFFFEIEGFRFLFTGDYSFNDYWPIPGIYQIQEEIPTPIDFLLVDGSFADLKYNAPSYQFNFLKQNLKQKADHANKVLIGADPASIAIVFYLTIFNFFINLKENEKYEKRPLIFLNRKVYNFVSVLSTRVQDLHPATAKNIHDKLNPFQSVMIRWIREYKDKNFAEGELRAKKSLGCILIFDPPDLSSDWMLDFFKIVGSNRFNAIYLAGSLRNQTAIELASGTDNLTLNYTYKKCTFQNKARILNRIKPENILNLHGDEVQLKKLLQILQPRRVCLFQQDPKKLISVRNWIRKDYPFVEETLAFYYTSKKEIEIKKKRSNSPV